MDAEGEPTVRPHQGPGRPVAGQAPPLAAFEGVPGGGPFQAGTQGVDAAASQPPRKVFAAYAQNRTPGAYRIFWCYGPGKKDITILAITPHP